MKGRLRPLDYIVWAQTVPKGARWDLTASGVPDSCGRLGPPPWELGAELSASELARRDQAPQIHAEFLRAVADRYEVAPECVVPTLGASGAISQALITLARPGDHVIVERPTYEPLHRVPELLGLQVSRLERQYDEGWAPLPDRLARLLTPKTRAVVLSSLHNPSGVAIETDTLEAIGELAARVGAQVLVDEVYLDFCLEPRGAQDAQDQPWRPACLTLDNGVSWSSTTKAFGFSALRAGWMLTRDLELAQGLRSASQYVHGDPPLASLALATEVLDHGEVLVERANSAIGSARAVLETWLEAETRLSWIPPSAGQTCLLRLPGLTSDVEFCRHLRERYGTQLVPGTMFEAPGFVRASFNLPAAELEQALATISASLDDWFGLGTVA